ncbi:hypothetical protein IQ270_09185 [Microcoleus sp. LEGE 07076]|uniref:hypothetical protein n=1 Tax=Microcoleus sp. LEGE 07076 TaxID=915322 RepID=UPI00187FEF08|nr:hypothetical protein [Microcoleus sp. LEGE 07076]MBE9184878.1 hypothetical protein [Microcoleus sp. LEGE 07076]
MGQKPVFLVRGGGHRLCRRGFNRRVFRYVIERAEKPVFLFREGGLCLSRRGFNRRVSWFQPPGFNRRVSTVYRFSTADIIDFNH